MDWYDKFTNLPSQTIKVILFSYFIGISLLTVAITYWALN